MDALYYPDLLVPEASWLNPILLFFDAMFVIAPEAPASELFDKRTEALIYEGLVRPVNPMSYAPALAADEALLERLLRRANTSRSSGVVSYIHVGKLAYSMLVDTLINAGLLRRSDGSWLEGPDWVITEIMSYLAVQIAGHEDVRANLLARETVAFRAISRSRSIARRELAALSELLPVPETARPAEIASFKARHANELEAFRGYIERRFQEPAWAIRPDVELAREVELRQHLVGELRATGWRGFVKPVTLGAVSVLAPFFEKSYLSAAASGMLAFDALSTAHQRRREARSSPLVYAAYAADQWRRPSHRMASR